MTPIGIPPRPGDSKRKTWVFNPPPGWPAQPAKWEPEADWHPDPSWPPAPPGWEFWRPASRHQQRGAGFYVKAAAGVLTFAATITGTYVAIKGQPPEYTTADWVNQANATCDQDSGALSLSLFDGLAPSAAGQGDTSTQSSFDSKVSAVVTAAGSVSKLVGDLGVLQTPKDSRAPEVQAVISSGNALVNSLDTLSNDLVTVVDNTSRTTILQQYTGDTGRLFSSIVVWQKAIKALGLTQCPFWVSNPNLTPITLPTISPTPTASLTEGQRQLVSLLNSNDLTNCTGRSDLEGNGIVVAVNCHNTGAGPAKRPLVVQFADIGSARQWFSSNTAGFVGKDACADGEWHGTWSHDGVTAGMLGCSHADGGFRIVWIIDNALIGVIADGSDGPAMYEWWKDTACLGNPGAVCAG